MAIVISGPQGPHWIKNLLLVPQPDIGSTVTFAPSNFITKCEAFGICGDIGLVKFSKISHFEGGVCLEKVPDIGIIGGGVGSGG